ncbi:tubby C-terminal-like domain-containing protein [Podospora conica]|nr:tubby C-terminal-like domain-containing protein [Schizothecium conicum]
MALAPVPQPLGIWNQFLARQSEVIILREKVMSLSGDSFDIALQTGQPILRVQGKVMSLTGRKSVYDMSGNHLFDIVKELLHIHATFAAVNPAGQKLLEVKSSFALLGSKATATFTNAATATPETLMMKGNWLDSAADIVDQKTGFVVGRINRKLLSGRDLLFGQQTYALTVAPGVDMALLVAMCICMDEKNNEGKGGLF